MSRHWNQNHGHYQRSLTGKTLNFSFFYFMSSYIYIYALADALIHCFQGIRFISLLISWESTGIIRCISSCTWMTFNERVWCDISFQTQIKVTWRVGRSQISRRTRSMSHWERTLREEVMTEVMRSNTLRFLHNMQPALSTVKSHWSELYPPHSVLNIKCALICCFLILSREGRVWWWGGSE